MAKGGMNKTVFEPGAPKKTRQGRSARTLLSATSRNGRKKKYRGQGIAAIMYDYAKELGYEVQRSYEQTDSGAHFWDKNRGVGSKVWEQQ